MNFHAEDNLTSAPNHLESDSQTLDTGTIRVWIVPSLIILVLLLVRSLTDSICPIDHDCAMYVRFGQLLLEGKMPYVDFIDLNPPLIFYVSAIPAAISKYLSINPVVSFDLFTFVLVLLSWSCTTLILVSQKTHPDSRYFGPLILTVAFVNLAIREWSQYGQRDHLFVLALFPFFFLRWLRWNGYPVKQMSSLLIGAAFGLTLALKPQYLPIPVALEAYWLVTRRQLKLLLAPEAIGILTVLITYLAHFYFLPAAMNDAFFHRWIPLSMQGYGAFDRDRSSLLWIPFLTGCTPLIVLGVLTACMLRPRASLTVPFLVWALAGYAAFALQMKGWFNHCLPMMAGCCLLGTTELGRLFRSLPDRARNWLPARTVPAVIAKSLCLLLILTFCVIPWVVFRQLFIYKYAGADRAVILRETQPGDPVTVLSTSVPDAYPTLLLTGRPSGSRYAFLFPIKMIRYMRSRYPADLEKFHLAGEERRVLSEVAYDIKTNRPELILIEESDKEGSPSDKSLAAYLKEKNFYEQALKDYERTGSVQGLWSKLAVWKRRGGKATPRARTPAERFDNTALPSDASNRIRPGYSAMLREAVPEGSRRV